MYKPRIDRRWAAVVATVWLLATLATAFFFPMLGSDEQVVSGLPWVVVLAVICQASIFGLFVFVAKSLWRVDEGVRE